jgi:general secretion pathway protein F
VRFMPLFQYSLLDAIGVLRTGTMEAENDEILKRRLEAQGFRVREVKRVPDPNRGVRRNRMHGGIRSEDRLAFWLEFALLLDSNTPLLRALQITAEQAASRKMRAALHSVMEEVEAGIALFDALDRRPKAFDSIAVGMIRAGEVGGALPEAVRRYCRYLEADMRQGVETRQRGVIIALMLAAISTILLFCFLFHPGSGSPGH